MRHTLTSSLVAVFVLGTASGAQELRAFVAQHCIGCHAGDQPEADLTLDQPVVLAGREAKELVLERLRLGDMPPKGEPQPSAQARHSRAIQPESRRLPALREFHQGLLGLLHGDRSLSLTRTAVELLAPSALLGYAHGLLLEAARALRILVGMSSGRSVTWLIAICAFAWSCNGRAGSEPGGAAGDSLVLEGASVQEGQTWELNRPIDLVFSQDIDFATVSLNTIQIVDAAGVSAVGSFASGREASGAIDARRVRFQPACPTDETYADAGFQPGGRAYTLSVIGSGPDAVTVRSTSGEALAMGLSVRFQTPQSLDPRELFLDTVPGPPALLLRGLGTTASDEIDACYVELGGDPTARLYFDWNATDATGELTPGTEVALNRYSDPGSRIAIVVHLNQPIVPSASNLEGRLIDLQYRTSAGEWLPVPTQLRLQSNCTESGSALRLTPLGILPQSSVMRLNVRRGLEDLNGDATPADLLQAATVLTRAVQSPGTADPSLGADEVLELFLVSGAEEGSLEDVDAAFATPHAEWGAGTLSASFGFGGSGGPGGNFDWIILPGASVTLDTSFTSLVGGPEGTPSSTQAVINGVVDVRDLVIHPGASLTIVGPNTCTILASGEVRIEGEINLSGAHNPGVGNFNSANLPAPGAAGQAGGGYGGAGSFLTSQSTPRGERGGGAFNIPAGGGQGGETSYHQFSKQARRGAGGGGGRLGPDVFYPLPVGAGSDDDGDGFVRCQTLLGLDAENGFPGGRRATAPNRVRTFVPPVACWR